MREEIFKIIKLASEFEKSNLFKESDRLLKIYTRLAQNVDNPTSTPKNKRGINNFINPKDNQVGIYNKFIKHVANLLKAEINKINNGEVGKTWDKEKRKRHLENFFDNNSNFRIELDNDFQLLTSLQKEAFLEHVKRIIEQLSDKNDLSLDYNKILFEIVKRNNLTQEYIEKNEINTSVLKVMIDRAKELGYRDGTNYLPLNDSMKQQLDLHGKILYERARSFDK